MTFWKQFFKALNKVSEKTEKLKAFEHIVLNLLEQIVHIMMAEEEVFEDFNSKSEKDEDFDNFFL